MTENKRILRKYDGKKLNWFRAVRKFVILVLALFLVFRYVIGFSVVDGVSMRNTFAKGDIVLYTRIHKEVNIGDVVTVRIPSGVFYIKRVVAKGGDVIDLKDGVLYVNGVAEEGSYVLGQTRPEGDQDGHQVVSYPYVVPDGYIFAVGDNREDSIDSRSFGAVPESGIKGVVHVHISQDFRFKLL